MRKNINMARKLFQRVVYKFGYRAIHERGLAFIHMPKCAGTSIQKALSRSLLVSPQTIDINSLRKTLHQTSSFENEKEFYATSGSYQNLLLTYYLNRKATLISGHFTVSSNVFENFKNKYWFVTCLRDPVERFISQYLYDKLYELKNNKQPNVSISDNERKNELQQYMQSWRGWFVSHIYIWMLGGYRQTHKLNSRVAQEIAKANLERFDLVGFTFELSEFSRLYEELVGCEIKMERHNSTDKKSLEYSIDLVPYFDLFTPGVRSQIADLCSDDYEVYDYARQIFPRKTI